MNNEQLQEYKTRVRNLLRATNKAKRIEYNRSNLIRHARLLDERQQPHDFWEGLRIPSR
jgi:hypothetical protein